MTRPKRPSVPEDELSPQELKKRKDNTESQRRRRLRIQEKSKRALNSEPPDPNDGEPTGQQAITLRDNLSASESNVAIREPNTTETETGLGPNLDFEFMQNDDFQTYPTPAYNLYNDNSATWLSSDICPATPLAAPPGDTLSLPSSNYEWMTFRDLLDENPASNTNPALPSLGNWDMLSSLILRMQKIQREQQDLEFMRKIHEKERILADLYEAYQDLIGST